MVDISVSSFGKSRSSWALVGVFTTSIFLSAVLLFSVQPMFAKLVLPLLGGSSSVWNTAMVFFQGTLLAGYIYAHIISKYLKIGMQILVHGAVLAFGCLFLPLSIAEGWTPPETGAQSFWLIALFAVSVGAPFFAISANAPLLQRWFSRTNDKDADDPYFLYAASNVGSLLSLCLYPIFFEPLLRLREQTGLWAFGYVILICAIMLAGLVMRRNQKDDMSNNVDVMEPLQAVSLRQRLTWICLAFIPSSLMLGVTSHITNNIGSAPFLWIMPLALYLLTFIIVFAKNPIITSNALRYVTPIAVLGALWASFFSDLTVFISITIILVCYFFISLACHMKLVDKRPAAQSLTEFYIWMSLGGVLGGIFNALLAPLIFSNVFEYVIVLIVSFFIGSSLKKEVQSLKAILVVLIPCVFASAVVFAILSALQVPIIQALFFSGLITAFGLSTLNKNLKTSLALNFILVFMLAYVLPLMARQDVLVDRSFFGILHVKAETGNHGVIHKFSHGDTIHNIQLRDEELQTIPLAYYAEGNTFDRGLKFVRNYFKSERLNITMVGLGAGAMACYETPNDNWVYFEIDPAVVDMAMNPDYFSYMSKCSIKSDVRIGDARLKLNDLPDKSQDYIVIDAFSSNSIPTHLVTREALALYQSKLKKEGMIFFHSSNRVLDVSSVVVNIASDAGLDSRYIEFQSFTGQDYAEYMAPSSALLIGSTEQMQAATKFDANWKKIIPSPDVGLWTDDYSHIVGTLTANHKNNKQILEASN